MSQGSKEKLSYFVEAARRDYRDVLFWSANSGEPPAGSQLDVLRQHRGWALSEPVRVIAQNPFGNLLVEVSDGIIWRVCPEDLSATRLADSAAALVALSADDDFKTDWEVESWIEAAKAKLGPLEQRQCYGFRIWPVLGAEYSADNMAIKALLEWLAASGDVGRQVKDLPPGARIRLDTGDA